MKPVTSPDDRSPVKPPSTEIDKDSKPDEDDVYGKEADINIKQSTLLSTNHNYVPDMDYNPNYIEMDGT